MKGTSVFSNGAAALMLAGLLYLVLAHIPVRPVAVVPKARPAVDWFFQTYRDPATNTVPAGIRAAEVAHVRSLPSLGKGTLMPEFRWREAGPDNLGGRTRAFGVDVSNPQVLLAGGVTGGLWKSEDRGASWRIVSDDHLAVTTLAQDPRAGHRQTWYYGGGEYVAPILLDNRATAPFFGTGLYRSTDGGDTWQRLAATVDPAPTQFENAFDFVHRIVVQPQTGTVLVATNGYGIFRSTDGGGTFSQALGGPKDHEWSEVAVATDGTLVAVLSSLSLATSSRDAPGVYRSTDDGVTWTRLNLAGFPTTHRRTVVAFAPSNPAVAYSLTFVGYHANGDEDVRFFKIDVPGGTGEHRTANLPDFAGSSPQGAQIYTQFSYNMVLAVKPDDENFVVTGGTSLFRSRDAFATPASADLSESIIGGYTNPTTGGSAANHYVDMQSVQYDPTDPDVLWNTNDGGIYRTDDVAAKPVAWAGFNEGFNVTQFYAGALPWEAGDGRIAGGLQDLGGQYLQEQTDGSFTAASRVLWGDGAGLYFGQQFAYGARQFGNLRRIRYLNAEQTSLELDGTYIGTTMQNPDFIQPFAVDPNAENTIYMPDGNQLLRNTNVQHGAASALWRREAGLTVPAGYRITALAISREPAHVLYLGATHASQPPRLYRLADAHTATGGLAEVSVPGVPGGAYLHRLAVNPLDADELLVVFSNYNLTGLYHTTDGGQTFTAVEGNLTGDTAAPGPSLRSATILPVAEPPLTVYAVGTSAGLFVTDVLAGDATAWVQAAPELIGQAVVEDLHARPSDGRLLAATHGRGLFVGDFDPASVATEAAALPEGFALHPNYPNPFNPVTTLRYTLATPAHVTLTVFDAAGRRVRVLETQRLRGAGTHTVRFDAEGLASGAYVYRLRVVPVHDAGQAFVTSRTMALVR